MSHTWTSFCKCLRILIHWIASILQCIVQFCNGHYVKIIETASVLHYSSWGSNSVSNIVLWLMHRGNSIWGNKNNNDMVLRLREDRLQQIRKQEHKLLCWGFRNSRLQHVQNIQISLSTCWTSWPTFCMFSCLSALAANTSASNVDITPMILKWQLARPTMSYILLVLDFNAQVVVATDLSSAF